MIRKQTPFRYLSLALGIAFVTASCGRDDEPVPVIPPSDGTEMKLEGGEGGSSAINTVFVDLSAANQESIKRDSWNLGFYGGADFRVILNSTNGSSAVVVDKTDINAVSVSDINIDDLNIPLGTPGAFGNFDDVSGDIKKTLIAEISATEANNKVYVVNPKGGSHAEGLKAENLYKIRILREGGNYKLQYAKLADKDFKTLSVNKDEAYNFKYISFTNGPVNVEPKKADWDFQWTWSVYFGMMGTNAYPYGFSDLVFINHLGGTTAAEIVVEGAGTATKPTYENFAASHIAGVTFNKDKGVIGAKWRVTAAMPGASSQAGAQKDRYYVIRDAANNVYKVRFNAMGAGNDGGQRGYPELEYKLVK